MRHRYCFTHRFVGWAHLLTYPLLGIQASVVDPKDGDEFGQHTEIGTQKGSKSRWGVSGVDFFHALVSSSVKMMAAPANNRPSGSRTPGGGGGRNIPTAIKLTTSDKRFRALPGDCSIPR